MSRTRCCVAIGHAGAAEQKTLGRGGEPVGFEQAGALPSGDPGQSRRPVAGLRRQREVVAFADPPQQRERFAEAAGAAGSRGHRRDRDCPPKFPGSGRIPARRCEACGIGPLDAADKRRRQQHVAEPAQRHDENARSAGQANRRHRCAIDEFAAPARRRSRRRAPTCRATRARGCRSSPRRAASDWPAIASGRSADATDAARRSRTGRPCAARRHAGDAPRDRNPPGPSRHSCNRSRRCDRDRRAPTARLQVCAPCQLSRLSLRSGPSGRRSVGTSRLMPPLEPLAQQCGKSPLLRRQCLARGRPPSIRATAGCDCR